MAFQVFCCRNGTVIAVSVDTNGVVEVYDDVRPNALPKIGEFEADGVSDFNHGMRRMLERDQGEKAK